MTPYIHVKCPKFIRRDPTTGAMQAIQCKMCGDVIADTVERTVAFEMDRAGNKVKVVNRKFTMFPNYTEAKIIFHDGTFHVTHGCRRCMTLELNTDALDEIHRADQEDSPDGYTEAERNRSAVAVTVVRHDQAGIP